MIQFISHLSQSFRKLRRFLGTHKEESFVLFSFVPLLTRESVYLFTILRHSHSVPHAFVCLPLYIYHFHFVISIYHHSTNQTERLLPTYSPSNDNISQLVWSKVETIMVFLTSVIRHTAIEIRHLGIRFTITANRRKYIKVA